MKNLILITALFFIATSAFPQFYYGPGKAVNLENDIGYNKNGQLIKAGVTADPQTASVTADAGSLILHTNGSAYVKKDAGDSINWKKFLDESTNLFSYMTQATAATDGWLSSTDWNTFNNKSDLKTINGVSPIIVTQDTTTATISLGVADYVDFNTSATLTVPRVAGRIHWDDSHKAMEIDIDAANNVSQTVGEEIYVSSYNLTGVQINDGQVVYINGASTDFPTIDLASNATYDQTIGVATQNIPNGVVGKVTILGSVGGFNTSSFTAGDPLYLSSTASGSLTNVRPASNIVQVARAMNSNASGNILVDVKPTSDDLTLDPSGFIDPTQVTVTYDGTTRKITLTGTYIAVWKNFRVKELTNGWVSDAHPATTNVHFLYYNGSSFVWSTTPWSFDMLMIASVYYDGVNNIALREVHSVMPWQAHRELHQTIGTYLQTGADLSGYVLASTTAANRRPLVSAATIIDEDLPTTIAAITTESYSRFFLSGAAVANYAFAQTDIVSASGARPFYNQFSSPNWVQTQMSSNAYQAVWLIAIPVTSDANSQRYRYLWVQGQSESTTLSTINALTPADVNLNGLVLNTAELVFVAKVIIQYVGSPTNNWRITSVTKLTGSRYNQTAFSSSNFLSSITTDASFTGNGSVSSPLALSGTVTTTGYHYYGTDSDDSYRVYQSGGALITEKKVSGVWTEVSRLDNF